MNPTRVYVYVEREQCECGSQLWRIPIAVFFDPKNAAEKLLELWDGRSPAPRPREVSIDGNWCEWNVEIVARLLENADQASTVWRRHVDYSKLDVRTIYVADVNDEMPTPANNVARHQPLPQDIKIEDVAWSVRAFNILQRDGFRTLGDICQKTTADLLNLRHSGKRTLIEIIEKLAEHGLKLKEE